MPGPCIVLLPLLHISKGQGVRAEISREQRNTERGKIAVVGHRWDKEVSDGEMSNLEETGMFRSP